MPSPVISWLKQLFTVQTVALLIAFVTLLVTWRQLDVSTSGDAQLQLSSDGSEVNVTNIEQCYIYRSVSGDTVLVDNLLPILYNGDNRAVKNLAFTLRLYPYNCYFLGFNDDSIKCDYGKEYTWVFNQLPAFMSQPLPIKSVVITDSLYSTFKLSLKVSYDGIKKPLTYTSEVDLCQLGDDIYDPFYSSVYMLWRNQVFDDIHEKFESTNNDKDEYCIVIGDTILMSINDMKVFDRSNFSISSLSEISMKHNWLEPILTVLLLFYLFYCTRLIRLIPPLFNSMELGGLSTKPFKASSFISRTIDNLVVQYGLSKFEAYIVLFLSIPSATFFIFVITYMWVNWAEIMH